MFLATTTPLEVAGAVGTVSAPLIASLMPYAIFVAGMLIGYWIIKKVIGLIPKHK